MSHRITLFLILLFSPGLHRLSAQVVFPIHTHNGQNIETCSGIFVDSGADTLTPYGPGENYSITFTSDGPTEGKDYIKLSFRFFSLGAGDVMRIYDGPDDSSPLLVQGVSQELKGREIWSTGQSLHIRFESSPSDQGLGWLAEIECFSQCEAFTANVSTATGSFDFCPDTQIIDFTAQAEYIGGDRKGSPSNLTYNWYFEGVLREGRTVSHTYSGAGAYPFTLTVTDPENGCETSLIKTVRLATVPSFNSTISTADTVCARESFSLLGNATATTWTGFPTTKDTLAFINQGRAFSSQLVFDVFEEGLQLQSIQDFDRVCIDIEHVDFGDLFFELECPNGTRVVLKDFSPGGANLGEPVVFNDNIPGRGYEYCFKVEAQFGTMSETSFRFHEYLDQAGNYYFNQPYLPAGSYTPAESFNALAGCPVNGTWTLTAEDNNNSSSGHIFGWSLFFNEDFYPDSLIFTPQILTEQWFENGNLIGDNPVNLSKEEKGDYQFTFRATDNFGCSWDTTLVVTVLPLPKAEIVSDLEIPVCEGDSTIFTLTPLDDSPFHWVYQWMLEAGELPGRIFDTLMAKDPVNYSVMVTDTITGCFDFFELLLETQNCDLMVPNVFTPNGDGINDFFEVTNLEYYPNSQMVIFNRNGKKIFEHNDYFGNWWDGNNHPEGTYFYVLTYTRQDKKRQTQGIVTIIR